VKVSDFHYDLPQEAIAQSAIEPRHDSRLLDTRDLSDNRFIDLPGLLRPGDLLVVNETRVRAARLTGTRRETGGTVEMLLLERGEDGVWEALAKPARRLRPGIVIDFEGMSATVVSDPREGVVALTLDVDDEERVIAGVGVVPLPPYFHGRLPDENRYQTMFANHAGSAAAPTAALHFTPEVMDGLDARGVSTARVDLHVSLDTFRPMSTGMVEDHRMHSEWCSIPDTTAQAINEAGRVVAVGTTVVRTLESFATGPGQVTSGSRQTDLFLRPGSEFRVVDGLITNFHMPESTLLVLLAAFMGDRWREAYETAVARGYRFLSFGDAMYAERD
jgi:S-adenosylmethionine:tRNA ribosyltransferase-isomerase